MAQPSSPAPRVSVIVPAYGVAHVLGEALASLKAQHFQDWEAIVVDDGAPDDVATAFAPFAGDPRFRLLQTDNRGPATARNRAIAASRAPLLALLDGDDQYEPAYLDRMLAAIEADPQLGFVSCDAIVFGAGERKPTRYSSRYPMNGPVTLERVLGRQVAIFIASIIRRVAFDEVGGFDATLRGTEDIDLWIRLLAAGWRGAIVPEPLARYRRRPGSLSSSERPMLAATCTAFRYASAALDGRPEKVVADRQLASYEQKLRWLDGEDAILRGEVAAGLPLLADAGRRSRRWGFALAIMRRAPRLAAFLLKIRRWLPDLRRFGDHVRTAPSSPATAAAPCGASTASPTIKR